MKKWVLILILIGLLYLIVRVEKKHRSQTSRVPPYFLSLNDVNTLPERVVILYDSAGIPHVKARTPEGFAWALGWLHAQDRWLELDRIRHLFGRCRTQGEIHTPDISSCPLIQKVSSIPPPRYSKEQERSLKAYRDGMNTALKWMEEHGAIGIGPEGRTHVPSPWTKEDVSLVLNFFLIRTLPRYTSEGASGKVCQGLSAGWESFFFSPFYTFMGWIDEKDENYRAGFFFYSQPLWPGPLYRVHWVRGGGEYIAGDVVSGTPFWFAVRTNFLVLFPFMRFNLSVLEGSEALNPEEIVENTRNAFIRIQDVFSRTYPSVQSFREVFMNGEERRSLDWVALDYYHSIASTASVCGDDVLIRDKGEIVCNREDIVQKMGQQIFFVCPGSTCPFESGGVPAWVESILAYALNNAPGFSDRDVSLPAFDQNDLLNFTRKHFVQDHEDTDRAPIFQSIMEPLSLDAFHTQIDVLHPVWNPLAQPIQIDKGKEFFLLLTPLIRDRSQRWSHSFILHDLLFADLRHSLGFFGLLFHPENGLGGDVLGADMPTSWKSGLLYRIMVDEQRVESFAVAKQIFSPTGSSD